MIRLTGHIIAYIFLTICTILSLGIGLLFIAIYEFDKWITKD